jgi:hypothetical protein
MVNHFGHYRALSSLNQSTPSKQRCMVSPTDQKGPDLFGQVLLQSIIFKNKTGARETPKLYYFAITEATTPKKPIALATVTPNTTKKIGP